MLLQIAVMAGTHVIHAAESLDLFNRMGTSECGFPVTNESPTADGAGRYTRFRAVHLPGKPVASIYYSDNWGAKAIYGAIRDEWLEVGGVDSSYSAPARAIPLPLPATPLLPALKRPRRVPVGP
jgi:hypothetical protein